MKQVVQEVRSGRTTVREIPAPIAGPGQVVVGTMASLLSAGTERYVVELARKSLLGKARQRPDQVRRVLEKVRQEGLVTTFHQVVAKLDEPMPLGYSAAGVVLELGRGVSHLKPGDRVAVAGPHAGVVAVGTNLCARIPDEVSFEQAAYTSVGAIALEGVRLAGLGLGERVLVIGLGLIGQITVCLLKAQGCRVLGTDLDPDKLELARALGADEVVAGNPSPDRVRAFAGGHGVDAVIITAATASNAPIELAAAAARVRGKIVLVGVVGLEIPRQPFFEKELTFTVSSSLGPGRFDQAYADKGIDYPVGHVRWTMQRNMEAVLDTIAQGKLPVERLTSHRFAIDRAPEAYDLITGATKAPFLGVILEHPPAPPRPSRRVELRRAPPLAHGDVGLSLIGAGNYARLILMPMLEQQRGVRFRGLCTAKGMSAEHSGRVKGYAYATTEVQQIWDDPDTHAVLIATRHDLHAELVIAALRAGKHVFVEKPLCIRMEELEAIARCVDALGERCPVLMVGYNRRFAPATTRLRELFAAVKPLSISYRFSVPPIPPDHWVQDEEVGGGRIVGEATHAIDTCVALTGSPPLRVYAESVGKVGGLDTTDDRVFITLRHHDGSVSSVSYQSGGDRALPPERIEIFGGGKVAILDGWDTLEIWANGEVQRERAGKDKGQKDELEAFFRACRGGVPPIPWEHVLGVTEASLLAVRSLREGFPEVCSAPGEIPAVAPP
ncbi:bi-domain-containing oxidoreductase [Chondromyces apiculatus]|uniref:Sorbitol dehydrogenase n=1 Tax=Chondromyces apiculatus DSM 436 TaxID=1192034 RepID=A0A017T5L4_9BACT|nr:bi-domain-containing oxidoreductase [Chondromyces apiculatus]EYF03871.1 Sorbitol dehydrogenase [Chondromyces apiculatus DSM 436]